MSQRDPHVSDTEQRHGLTSEKLIDGEVTDDEVGTNMFPILFRTYRYPRLAWRITGVGSSTSMAARRWRVVADLPSSVKM